MRKLRCRSITIGNYDRQECGYHFDAWLVGNSDIHTKKNKKILKLFGTNHFLEKFKQFTTVPFWCLVVSQIDSIDFYF